jgi:hypothetical protein
VINEHFEEDFNAVLSSAIVFQQPVKSLNEAIDDPICGRQT